MAELLTELQKMLALHYMTIYCLFYPIVLIIDMLYWLCSYMQQSTHEWQWTPFALD